jgi:4-hydroxy-tetrahydrodipicolinate synthase
MSDKQTSEKALTTYRDGVCGPWAATLTPLVDGRIDKEKLAAHCLSLIENGLNGVVLFGSTGEAASFTVAERRESLDYVREAGLPGEKIIVGTGCCATPDTVNLTSHAIGNECAGVLVIPPYFYKPLQEQGLFDAYARLIDSVATPKLKIFLYHFPDLSGVPITSEFLQRLRENFPDQIAGIKDSTGDLDNTLALIKDFPELRVFTGDDDLLWPAAIAGGAGSVTATANIIPRELASVWRAVVNGADQPPAEHKVASDVWQIFLEHYPIVEALKESMVRISGNPSWRSVREPLCELPESERSELISRIVAAGLPI